MGEFFEQYLKAKYVGKNLRIMGQALYISESKGLGTHGPPAGVPLQLL